MDPPVSKAPKQRIPSKKVHEIELENRLGLDTPWIESRWQGGKRIVDSIAPEELPQSVRDMLNGNEIKEVESSLDSIVVAGCQRPVLYYCLAQLSDEAKAIREGRRELSVPDEDGEYRFKGWAKERPYATREELEAVRNNADKTRHILHHFRRELLLAAHAGELHSPLGETVVEDVEALQLIEESLHWVASLAQAYTPPLLDKLLEAKGYIFLTTYVMAHADGRKSPGQRKAMRDRALQDLVGKFYERGQESSDLREKLLRFKRDYPRLYKLLRSKLDELHRFHQKR